MIKKGVLTLLLILGVSVSRSSVQFVEEQLSYECVYEQIVEMGIKFPDVVFAQAVLESGNFKSNLFKNHNNLFGMKLPKIRETVATGMVKNGYAKYDSWSESIYDYFLWQNYILSKKNILTKNEYLAYVNRVYAEGKNYGGKLRRIISQHQDIVN